MILADTSEPLVFAAKGLRPLCWSKTYLSILDSKMLCVPSNNLLIFNGSRGTLCIFVTFGLVLFALPVVPKLKCDMLQGTYLGPPRHITPKKVPCSI